MDPIEVNKVHPQANIFTPQILILLGAAFSLIGLYFLWQALVAGEWLRDEWTAEEKKQALIELVERAESQGVQDIAPDVKLRLLQGLGP